MATSKTYSEREVVKILRNNGYVLDKKRGKGSHKYYYNAEKDCGISIPLSLNKMLVRRIIRENDLNTNRHFYNVEIK